MKLLKTIVLIVSAVFIWFVSESLTHYQLTQLEKSGEIPYGPVPLSNQESYIFQKESTWLFEPYSVNRISEFSRHQFESIILNSLNETDKENLRPYLNKILSKSEEYQLDPFWVLSIVMVESRFKSDVKSNKNAHGIMQIQPETAMHIYQIKNRELTEEEVNNNLYNVDENLELGTFYLKKLLQNFRMNFKNATIAYNMGPNKLRSIMALDLEHESISDNDYYASVRKNYSLFAKNFRSELNLLPKSYEATYVVKNQGVKLEDFIYKKLGYFSYIPNNNNYYAFNKN